jgi:hypothetical protein
MSQENVELVRRHLLPHEDENLVPVFREWVDRLGPSPQPEEVLTLWAEDPSWRYVHPGFQWETVGGGPLDTKATGPTEIVRWWADWVDAWGSYVYRVVEHRDLGEWVLTLVDVRAEGRGGIPLTLRTFELRSIRDGKIAVCRIFVSEQEALEAAGLSE